MKLVKIFSVVMTVHAAVFMFVFAIPGCRSSAKKPSTAPAAGSDLSPVASTEMGYSSPIDPVHPASDTSSVRFSPTRPGSTTAAEVSTVQPVATPEATATYTVVKGDSLWSIARKHNVTVKQITAVNNMRSDATLKLGQKLTIPGKSAATVSSAAPSSGASSTSSSATATTTATHTVKSGETLGGIARKYGVKVGEIATANNIADPAKLRVGQSLKIPGVRSSSAPRATTTAPAVRNTPSAPVQQPVTPAPAPVAPTSPLFESPLMDAPTTPSTEASPFITTPDAPLIRVEESGAPRIE